MNRCFKYFGSLYNPFRVYVKNLTNFEHVSFNNKCCEQLDYICIGCGETNYDNIKCKKCNNEKLSCCLVNYNSLNDII